MTDASLPARNLPRLPVYLDYQATTPTDWRVLTAMLPYFSEAFGNPHSEQHRHGQEARAAVETARAQLAQLIGAQPSEIVFTSGATEANNLAIAGVARFQGERRRHIVTCATEHKCVLESVRALEADGFKATYLPVAPDGLLDLDRLATAVSKRTALVSVMAVNNEIGVIQPLAEIGRIARERGAYFHTDAAQAVGKIVLDVEAMNIDLMSISGHKFYAPKGVGALYVRRRPRVRLAPLFQGGGQERGLRSGTLATPLCVGLGEAAAIAQREMAPEAERLGGLAARLVEGLRARLPDVALNGDAVRRIPGNLNLRFGLDAERLMAEAGELSLSSGAACSSAALEPSYVLRALGLSEAAARGSLRLGLGRFTTEAEVDYAVECLSAAALRLGAAVARRAAGR